MSAINSYVKLDEYGLRHMGEHLYRLGPEYYSRLYELTISRGWHDAQREFDSSFQTYSGSLDWAFKAAESDQKGLAILPVISLLQATIRSYAGNIPHEAVILLSQLENYQQAQAYAEVQAEALAKCERLTKLAVSAWKEKKIDQAQKVLKQAEAIALSDPNLRTRAQALGLVAGSAHQIDYLAIYEMDIQFLKEILASQVWPFAQALRKYDLLNQPDYILAVLEWDRTNKMRLLGIGGWLHDESLPTIAGVAAAKKDRPLLDKIIAQHKFSISISNDLASAMTKEGCLEAAMEIIFAQRQRGLDTLIIRESMARAAGEVGDIDTIEYIAQITLSPPEDEKMRVANERDLDERVDELKDWFAIKAESALKRAGGGVLGISWERMVIMLAGVEGLLEHHPDKGRILWDRLESESNRVGKAVAREVKSLLFTDSGSPHTKGDRSPRLLPMLLNAGSRVAGWKFWDMEGTGTDEMLAELVEIKVQAGDIQGALSELERITDPSNCNEALLSLVKGTCQLGQFEEACNLVKKIKSPGPRKIALEEITKSLVVADPEQARTIIPRIFSLAHYIAEEEQINHCVQYAALVRSFSEDWDVTDTINWMQKVGLELNLSALVSLSQAAAKQKDIRSAKRIFTEIESRLSFLQQKNILPTRFTTTFLQGASSQIQPVDQLAEIVECWSTIVEEPNSPWLELARRVYALTRAWVDKNKMAQMWSWPALARAACNLKDRDVLLTMFKQMRKVAGPGNIAVDRALAKIAVGLTRTGDYLKPGNSIYPPAVEAIHWKYFKAQALAEMSEIVRMTLPRDGLFGKGLRSDEIDIRANALLHQSKVLLGLHNRQIFTPKFKSIPIIKAMPSSLSTTMNTPPREVAVETLSKIANIYSSRDMIEETKQIPTLVGDRDRPQISLIVIHALTNNGMEREAQDLLKECKSRTELFLGGLSLTKHNSPQTTKALSLVASIFCEILENPKTLKICINSLQKFQPMLKEHFIRECLRGGRQLNRKEGLLVVCALAPLLASLVGIPTWQKCVEKIVETETW